MLIKQALVLLSLTFYSHLGLAQASTTNKIEVSGTGKIFETPDMAYLNFTFAERGPDAEPVRKKVDEQVNALLKLSDRLGIARSDIQAAQLSISPEYDYKRDRSLLGYRVTRTVRLKLSELKHYSKLLDGAVKLGVTHTSSLQLAFSDRSTLDNQAMVLALQNARLKAEILAREAGGSLGRVILIVESGGHSPAPVGLRMMATESADASYPTGDLEISKTLHAHFELLYP